MKKILLLLSFSIISFSTLFAQNYQEVIYLKNGSMIKGVIVEQVPNDTYKIETADGSLFVFKWDEVLKITKEKIEPQKGTTYSSKDYSTVKYQGEFLVGYGVGYLDRVYIQTIQGIRVNKNFSVGLGFGFNIIPKYEFAYDMLEVYVPVYLNFKGYHHVSSNASIFGSLDVGGAFGVSSGLDGVSGFMTCPAFGVSIRDRLNISLGFDVQMFSDSYVTIVSIAPAVKFGCMF